MGEMFGFTLRDGTSQSCGCLQRERTIENHRVDHGHSRRGRSTPEYRAWRSMLGRCLVPTNHAWKHYGGRGITVCERWLEFTNFLADMGLRPAPHLTLDRHPNNNGNYEPGNCRWATRKQQTANRRTSVHAVECGDCGAIFRMSRTVIDMADEHGLSCPVCQSRDVAIESKD